MADYPLAEMDVSPDHPKQVLLVGTDFTLASCAPYGARMAQDLLAALAESVPDAIVLDAQLASAEVLVALAGPRAAGIPLLLLARDTDCDAAGLLLDLPIATFLAPDAGDAGLRAALDRLLSGKSLADATHGFDMESRMLTLRRDAERVAAALAELMAESAAPATAMPVDAPRIRAHIKARRVRERFFPADMFADPAWDILLDLAAARLEGRQVSVSSLCIAATVPTTTGLRWIKTMIDQKMLQRTSDPMDARRAFIAMTPGTEAAMTHCLDASLNLQGQW